MENRDTLKINCIDIDGKVIENEKKDRDTIQNTKVKKAWNKTVVDAVKNATNGILEATKTEKNLKREFIIALVVLLLGIVFKLEKIELIAVMLSIGFVMVTELINTAIEETVDMVTQKYNQKAKKAKDVAAGAVVTSTFFAFIVGYLVFIEKVRIYGITLKKQEIEYQYLTLITVSTILILIILFKVIPKIFAGIHVSGQAIFVTAITIFTGIRVKDANISSIVLALSGMVLLSRMKKTENGRKEVLLGVVLGAVSMVIMLAAYYILLK